MDLSSDEDENDVKVDRAYVEGPLFGATVTAGRTPVFTAQGLVFDDRISGATVAFGSEDFTATLAAVVITKIMTLLHSTQKILLLNTMVYN